MTPWFTRYGIVPLPLAQAGKHDTVGIYLMSENAGTPHIEQVLDLLREHVGEHLVELEG